jgi:hypothetical protein
MRYQISVSSSCYDCLSSVDSLCAYDDNTKCEHCLPHDSVKQNMGPCPDRSRLRRRGVCKRESCRDADTIRVSGAWADDPFIIPCSSVSSPTASRHTAMTSASFRELSPVGVVALRHPRPRVVFPIARAPKGEATTWSSGECSILF